MRLPTVLLALALSMTPFVAPATAAGPACSDGVDNDGDGLTDHPDDPGCYGPDDTREEDGDAACGNGYDDDWDGFVDHPDDPDCADANDWNEWPAACGNGYDDDGDGRVDFPEDPGCEDAQDEDEFNVWPACSNGYDDDWDGLTDHPDDPDCTSPEDETEWPSACSNGYDDDWDGLTDHPDDPDCASPEDETEWPQACGDGYDNDGDGLVDHPDDPGCTSPEDADEFDAACSDGVDNDGDGFVDYPADPHCASEFDGDESDPCPALALALAMAEDPGIVLGAECVTTPPNDVPNAVWTSPLSSFPAHGSSFAVLTSGAARFADDPDDSESTTSDAGGSSVRGDTDFDVTILRIDLEVPEGDDCLAFEFQFYSEEYAEYVGSPFNDAFLAELDTSDWTTSGSEILAPHNFAFDELGNPVSINAAGAATMTEANAAGTTYDGATVLLVARTPTSAGTHSLYLSIFDQGDRILDSAVFLDALRTSADPTCEPGIVPAGITVDVEMTKESYGLLEPGEGTVTVATTRGEPLEGADVEITLAYESGHDAVDALLAATPCATWETTGTTDADGQLRFVVPPALLARCAGLPGLAELPTDLLGGRVLVQAHATHAGREAEDATGYAVSLMETGA